MAVGSATEEAQLGVNTIKAVLEITVAIIIIAPTALEMAVVAVAAQTLPITEPKAIEAREKRTGIRVMKVAMVEAREQGDVVVIAIIITLEAAEVVTSSTSRHSQPSVQ